MLTRPAFEAGGRPGPLPLMGLPALCASLAARAACCFDNLRCDQRKHNQGTAASTGHLQSPLFPCHASEMLPKQFAKDKITFPASSAGLPVNPVQLLQQAVVGAPRAVVLWAWHPSCPSRPAWPTPSSVAPHLTTSSPAWRTELHSPLLCQIGTWQGMTTPGEWTRR